MGNYQSDKTDGTAGCHYRSGDERGGDETDLLNPGNIHSPAGGRMNPGTDEVQVSADKHQDEYPQKYHRSN
jgi:hypothetical protein